MPYEKLLILDLDETLVHAAESPLERPADFRAARFHVYRRPYLNEFLEGCLERFEVAVWTSGSPGYAQAIVREIFPEPARLAFVWASERCTQRYDIESGEYYPRKPLIKVRRKGYRRESILVVDDTPRKWEASYGNLICIRPYFGDAEDRELPALLRYLDRIRLAPDVRRIEKRGWWRQTDGTGNSVETTVIF